MTDELREVEPRPARVTVKVHKSSSRDSGLGWEITVSDGASESDVRRRPARRWLATADWPRSWDRE